MTSEQIEQLKTMSSWEITRKYFPLLQEGKINRKQYDALLSLTQKQAATGSGTSPDEPPVGRPDAPGSHGDRLTQGNDQAESVTRTSDVVSPGEFIQAFTATTHPRKASGHSQKDRLLSLLSDGEWHDTPSIQREVYGGDHLGAARIAARVNDLRQEGHKIESEKKAASIWHYRLVNPFKEIQKNILAG